MLKRRDSLVFSVVELIVRVCPALMRAAFAMATSVVVSLVLAVMFASGSSSAGNDALSLPYS